jgi:hypothetical protein
MSNPSHIQITPDKIKRLADKWITPREAEFRELIISTFPNAGEGLALMAAFMSSQLQSHPGNYDQLADDLFNFVIDYLANRDYTENPQDLN